jgi:hypothetical protein
MSTENWFFPNVVHLRMRDQSLLKFDVGPQPVPSDLPEEERAILKRHGAKPIEAAPKQASSSALLTAKAAVEAKAKQEAEAKEQELKAKQEAEAKVTAAAEAEAAKKAK